MNQSLFLESRNLFVTPPVDFEDWGTVFDYDKAFVALTNIVTMHTDILS